MKTLLRTLLNKLTAGGQLKGPSETTIKGLQPLNRKYVYLERYADSEVQK